MLKKKDYRCTQELAMSHEPAMGHLTITPWINWSVWYIVKMQILSLMTNLRISSLKMTFVNSKQDHYLLKILYIDQEVSSPEVKATIARQTSSLILDPCQPIVLSNLKIRIRKLSLILMETQTHKQFQKWAMLMIIIDFSLR